MNLVTLVKIAKQYAIFCALLKNTSQSMKKLLAESMKEKFDSYFKQHPYRYAFIE